MRAFIKEYHYLLKKIFQLEHWYTEIKYSTLEEAVAEIDISHTLERFHITYAENELGNYTKSQILRITIHEFTHVFTQLYYLKAAEQRHHMSIEAGDVWLHELTNHVERCVDQIATIFHQFYTEVTNIPIYYKNIGDERYIAGVPTIISLLRALHLEFWDLNVIATDKIEIQYLPRYNRAEISVAEDRILNRENLIDFLRLALQPYLAPLASYVNESIGRLLEGKQRDRYNLDLQDLYAHMNYKLAQVMLNFSALSYVEYEGEIDDEKK